MATLTDTGPLVALVDQGDEHHNVCMKAAAALMEKYNDLPMDLADASLVAAETQKLQTIFTLDSDFHVYRLGNDKESFEVIPDHR